MATIAIDMKPRQGRGKGPARELRRNGILPVVIYGGGKDPVSLQVESNIVEKLIAKVSKNTLLDVKVEGGAEHTLAMIKEIQKRTMSHGLVHMDLVRISMDKKVEVTVEIEILNTEDIKKNAGVVQLIIGEIPIKALPDRIPESLVLDLADVEVGSTLTASDLVVPEGVEVLLEDNESIVTILAPKVEKEKGEGEEGEEAAAKEGESEGDEDDDKKK